MRFNRFNYNQFLEKMPIFLSCLVFLTLMLWGYFYNWMQYKANCDLNCYFHFGESISSIYTAVYYQISGLNHWFIQQMPLTDDLDFFFKPSVFYTHNMNIGAFIIYLSAKLGFETIILSSIISITAYSFGIYFSYLYALAATNLRSVANWFIFFMATDFLYNLSCGLNLIRSWHWLALFGTGYAVIKKRYCLLVFTCLISFLVGYEFSAIVASVGVLSAYLYGKNIREKVKMIFFISSVFFLIFVLRQLQVIGGLGFEVWKNDFLYTFGVKIPSELRWFYIPSDPEISEWYLQNNIGRNTTTSLTFHETIGPLSRKAIIGGFKRTWNGLYLPFIFVIASVVIYALHCIRVKKIVHLEQSTTSSAFVSLYLGIACGMLPFFSHSWSVFFLQAFPLLSAPFYLWLAFSIVLLNKVISYYQHQIGIQRVVFIALLIMWSTQQATNYKATTPEVYPVNKINIRPYKFSFK